MNHTTQRNVHLRYPSKKVLICLLLFWLIVPGATFFLSAFAGTKIGTNAMAFPSDK